MKKSIAAVIISITLISLTACSDSSNQMIELTQKANSSAGNYWEYCLSNDEVIKEIDYYETSFLGPGYTQHWKFEIINDGMVTISWTKYTGGNDKSEKDSYDVIYCVSDGNFSIVHE